jgi:hypothetical protein
MTWAAFECSVLADLSGNHEEQARLFALGVKAGRDFLQAVSKKEISQDALDSEVQVS